MADYLNTRILLLNGTQTEWNNAVEAASAEGRSLVLKKGEPAVEFIPNIGSDSTKLEIVKIKIGDGFTKYEDLPYVGDEIVGQLAALQDSFNAAIENVGNAVFQIDAADLADVEGRTEADKIVAYLTAQNAEVKFKTGNIAIVKKAIVDENYSYTAYVYTDGKFAAMDGNYSAANVYTSSKITLAGDYGKDSRNDTITSIGNKRIGDTIEAGTSLQALLMDILSQRLQPSATNPSASIIFTNKSTSGANDEVEIGTTYNATFKTTFSDGKFTYDDVTGCQSTAATVLFDGKSFSIDANALNGKTGTMDPVVINNTTQKKLTLEYGWTASTITPKDNLGDPCTNDAKINAASGKTATSSHGVTGFRYAFGGSSASSMDVNSSNIRALASKTKSSNETFDVTIDEGAKFIMIAVPDGKKITKVEDSNAFGTDVFSEFTQVEGTVQVGGADATADNIGNYATAYNVWTRTTSTALSANTYTVTITDE